MQKHKALAESFVRQEQQLERIGKIMAEYKPRMEEPTFRVHYSEQLEMYDYFKYLLKKYTKQQDYLDKQVRGKVKDLELRARAVKLRNMVSHQQKVMLNTIQIYNLFCDFNFICKFRNSFDCFFLPL